MESTDPARADVGIGPYNETLGAFRSSNQFRIFLSPPRLRSRICFRFSVHFRQPWVHYSVYLL